MKKNIENLIFSVGQITKHHGITTKDILNEASETPVSNANGLTVGDFSNIFDGLIGANIHLNRWDKYRLFLSLQKSSQILYELSEKSGLTIENESLLKGILKGFDTISQLYYDEELVEYEIHLKQRYPNRSEAYITNVMLAALSGNGFFF